MAASPRVQSMVTVFLPSGRQFLWLSLGSPILDWRVGEAVDFQDRRWLVLERIEEQGSLTLRLGPHL